jgi:nucleotide-binding universal stress UspA family protein
LDRVGESVKGLVPVTSLVRMGDPSREIIAAAKELEIDLIILATHGRTGLSHFLLGSTAEKVVRRAGCPVLIVRDEEHEFLVDTGQQEN